MSDPEMHDVELLNSENRFSRGRFTLLGLKPGEQGIVCLRLVYGSGEIVKCAQDYFSAMSLVRLELEREVIAPKCYGAGKNVYPSPMSRSMADGTVAHKMTLGSPALAKDQVSIFATGPDIVPSYVQEQNDFYDTAPKQDSHG